MPEEPLCAPLNGDAEPVCMEPAAARDYREQLANQAEAAIWTISDAERALRRGYARLSLVVIELEDLREFAAYTGEAFDDQILAEEAVGQSPDPTVVAIRHDWHAIVGEVQRSLGIYARYQLPVLATELLPRFPFTDDPAEQ